MILHENRLPADDSHEISYLICYFLKSGKIFNCRLLQIIGGALSVKPVKSLTGEIDLLSRAESFLFPQKTFMEKSNTSQQQMLPVSAADLHQTC